MALHLPPGKRLAVVLGPDFDAQSVWIGTFRSTSQSLMARGEFGAEVGVPRLLDLFRRWDITTTWCIPTHTMRTFPGAVASIVDAGHEIGAHGVYHEFVPKLELAEERRLLELQIAERQRFIGRRPAGYRSPAFDVTDNTLNLLHEYEFNWDSSLMGRDFVPYHPRMVVDVDLEDGNTFGAPSQVLEIPVSWYLDDFPEVETIKGSPLMQSHDVLFSRWKDTFDYAYRNCPNGVMTLTLHPQSIGRAHHMLMLEKLVEYIASHEGVWFPTLSQVYTAWRPDD